jgi:preprotein translocase subunit SecF
VLEILHGVNVDWMGKRHIAYWISGICVLISIVSLIMHGGPRYGVDFTGGTLIELQVTPPLPVDNVRRAVDQAGFTGSEIQSLNMPGQYLVRIGLTELHNVDPAPRVREAVAITNPGSTVEIRKVETVGPRVGSELRGSALKAIFLALGLILVGLGLWHRPEWLALGWALHGGWDLLHHHERHHLGVEGVPPWYAVTCMVWDPIVAVGILLVL